MTGEWLASATGIKLTFVHYKGAAAPEIDLMAGRLHSIPKGLLSALPLIKSGKLKIIAIITGERTPLLPGVRTVAERTQAESGIPGFAYPSWVGLLAPGGTPPAIVDKLNADIIRAIKSPKAMNGWDAQGTVVVGTSPDGFRKVLINELAQWKKLVKENNIKVD